MAKGLREVSPIGTLVAQSLGGFQVCFIAARCSRTHRGYRTSVRKVCVHVHVRYGVLEFVFCYGAHHGSRTVSRPIVNYVRMHCTSVESKRNSLLWL